MEHIKDFISLLEEYGVNNILIFFGLVIISLLLARYFPAIIKFIISRFAPQSAIDIYEKLIEPISN